jgi:RNA polymerase sigma factor (sigma-70 family)
VFSDSDTPSLKELLAAVSAGDEKAKEQLRKRCGFDFEQSIKCLLYRKGCHSPDHYDEVYQSAFIKMLIKIELLKHPDKFDRWIKKIIIREVYSHVRRLKGCIQEQNLIVPYYGQEAFPPARISSAEEEITNALYYGEILEFAEEIHPKLPEIIFHWAEGLEFREIASLVEESYHNVRNIFYRGIKELQIILSDYDDDTKDHDDTVEY